MNYRLDCISHNKTHTTFRVFDRGTVGAQSEVPTRANCGTLTIQTDDLVFFVRNVWRGDIFWNNLVPLDVLDKQLALLKQKGASK